MLSICQQQTKLFYNSDFIKICCSVNIWRILISGVHQMMTQRKIGIFYLLLRFWILWNKRSIVNEKRKGKLRSAFCPKIWYNLSSFDMSQHAVHCYQYHKILRSKHWTYPTRAPFNPSATCLKTSNETHKIASWTIKHQKPSKSFLSMNPSTINLSHQKNIESMIQKEKFKLSKLTSSVFMLNRSKFPYASLHSTCTSSWRPLQHAPHWIW